MDAASLAIGIYVFDDVEALDFAGPYEVFTTAARVHGRDHAGVSPCFRVFTVGRNRDAVKARAGLKIEPDHTLADHPAIDCLIVPGGVVGAELEKPDVIAWIAAQAGRVPLVASVCTGAFLLARAGLFDGRRATTHWEDLDDLQRMFPAVQVQRGVRWVDQGALVSSAGISAGIDMSLHLVERLHSRELAVRTARQMEFDWTENPRP
ncbi:glutamine amidotransferase [Chitiniphilus shinanonensis]|uniref:Glutamine amidotransferase n=1 Tax=Chitiniphilus shinanonensis TaxID=553088 RepID=A0ABQ6C1I8_9NEIS|nr:DJ-1/PfpI family protein [Chitiniphilus shinanonensis]GLS06048.1 glutamine amidotransferase [Chitiniphilus shinanonensis]